VPEQRPGKRVPKRVPAGEVMLAAEEVMLAAVQTFACLPAASPSAALASTEL